MCALKIEAIEGYLVSVEGVERGGEEYPEVLLDDGLTHLITQATFTEWGEEVTVHAYGSGAASETPHDELDIINVTATGGEVYHPTYISEPLDVNGRVDEFQSYGIKVTAIDESIHD